MVMRVRMAMVQSSRKNYADRTRRSYSDAVSGGAGMYRHGPDSRYGRRRTNINMLIGLANVCPIPNTMSHSAVSSCSDWRSTGLAQGRWDDRNPGPGWCLRKPPSAESSC